MLFFENKNKVGFDLLPATPVGVFHAALVAALVVEVAAILAFPLTSLDPCPEDA